MSSELMTRKQLIGRWARLRAELAQSGQSTRHIDLFLARLSRLPGDTVGDIVHHWSVRQAGLRPAWNLLLLVMVCLGLWLGWKLAGLGAALLLSITLSLLGIAFMQHLWSQESQFCQELFARAEFALG